MFLYSPDSMYCTIIPHAFLAAYYISLLPTQHYRELYEEDKRRYEKQQKAYMLQKDNEASKDVTANRTDNNNNNN